MGSGHRAEQVCHQNCVLNSLPWEAMVVHSEENECSFY